MLNKWVVITNLKQLARGSRILEDFPRDLPKMKQCSWDGEKSWHSLSWPETLATTASMFELFRKRGLTLYGVERWDLSRQKYIIYEIWNGKMIAEVRFGWLTAYVKLIIKKCKWFYCDFLILFRKIALSVSYNKIWNMTMRSERKNAIGLQTDLFNPQNWRRVLDTTVQYKSYILKFYVAFNLFLYL